MFSGNDNLPFSFAIIVDLSLLETKFVIDGRKQASDYEGERENQSLMRDELRWQTAKREVVGRGRKRVRD